MKQVLQDLKDGRSILADVPVPAERPGHVLVRTARTLVSAGTERMLLDFGRANLIDKARQQPEKVRMVLDKIRTDGLMPTLDAVRNKLDQPLPMGYSNVGRVASVGAGVDAFAPGDRVVSNGWHAEYVSSPLNLTARVPEAVDDDSAAFTVVGAIGLQGIRLAQPTLGEAVVVSGLGLIGLVTVQLLRAQGCRVLGLDFDPRRLALARQFGAEVVNLADTPDPVSAALQWSRGRGVDAVLITAATKSNEPVHHAAQMCRKRGRIVLVGVTGLELSRADFYEKELSFQVSCSYGPGRYDPAYETAGHDYPVGFVRWTEQRNFEAVLDMMADGRLDLKPLITHRFAIDEAPAAYDVVGGSEPSLGILLEYPAAEAGASTAPRTVELPAASVASSGSARVDFIGAGNYATSVLAPAFRAAGARLGTVACSAGVSGHYAGGRHGFAAVTTDTDALLADPDGSIVVIATRHDSHADLVGRALEAGKHVFVEKPLCMTRDELERIRVALAAASPRPLLGVGFNRRYSPLVTTLRGQLAGCSGPRALQMTVNAGEIPADHWVHDPSVGGGRILGEACHFVDLLRDLAGAPIREHSINWMDGATRDSAIISLAFENGSVGTVSYLANGPKAFPKERLEVFCDGRVLQLDNFRRLRAWGCPGFSGQRLWRQDKGQQGLAGAFLAAAAGDRDAPIPVDQLLEVAGVMLDLVGDRA